MATRENLSPPPKDDSLQRVVAQNVKVLRKAHGLSKERLAVFANLTRDTINAVEAGDTDFRISTLSQIAEVFKVRAADLMSDAPDMSDLPFHRRLSEARQASGYSIVDLAQLLAMSRKDLSDFEYGRTFPDPDTLASLIELLRGRVPWLTADWVVFGRIPAYAVDRDPDDSAEATTPSYRGGQKSNVIQLHDHDPPHARSVVTDTEDPAAEPGPSSSVRSAKALRPKSVASQPIAVAPVTSQVTSLTPRARRPSPARRR